MGKNVKSTIGQIHHIRMQLGVHKVCLFFNFLCYHASHVVHLVMHANEVGTNKVSFLIFFLFPSNFSNSKHNNKKKVQRNCKATASVELCILVVELSWIAA